MDYHFFLLELPRKLSGMGNNLNQLARQANSFQMLFLEKAIIRSKVRRLTMNIKQIDDKQILKTKCNHLTENIIYLQETEKKQQKGKNKLSFLIFYGSVNKKYCNFASE